MSEEQNIQTVTSATSPKVVLLGTSGGPRWWGERAGIATAVVVDGFFYLVDCGSGVGRQLQSAGLELEHLRGIFVTHMHSDHVVDLASLGIFGMFELEYYTGPKIPIVGPADRGQVVRASPRADEDPGVLYPEEPTPGIEGFWEHSMRAHATDLNDRIRDSLRPSPSSLFEPREIDIPDSAGFHANNNPVPEIDPFEVFRDELVTVTATLVKHPPMAPAFAFRFDTRHGSVTISGDTAPTQNLVRLARNTDLLLHEVIDNEWITERYGNGSTPESKTMIDHHLNSHTTIEETARVANDSNADTLVLHHFVPGNRPLQIWERVHENHGQAIVGRDLMEIHFGKAYVRTRSGDQDSKTSLADAVPVETLKL
ncbi:MBL fold metallo-hydrolase [Arthrobacter sp. H14]|uniref:MBL fold metallo-hydrolase n=1 Tax=Arthrobacter sp. H14 TaxID=1312959 RepID=UPI0004ADCC5E|nr:MBL fold metallo-hydrolase [Arthrobacter sp. H14]